MKATKHDNRWIHFEFASIEERDMLEKATSYDIPGSQFSASVQSGLWSGQKKFLTASNKLSHGLFKSLFPEHALVYNKDYIPYTFDEIPLFTRGSWDRRQYQLDAINIILQNRRGIINASVGAGKTLIAAATISKHLELTPKGKVLFVCFDKNILHQTLTNMKKYGFKVSQYGDGVKDLSGDIVVAIINSLANIEKPSNILKNITMCIIDESHHGKSKTSKDILTKLKSCEYYIGLTGTPPKPGTLELAELVNVIGPVIYTYNIETATNAGNIAPVKCFFLKTPFSYETKGRVIYKKKYQYIWDAGIRDSEVRNRTIATTIATLNRLIQPPTLVQVDRTIHGSKIAEQCRLHVDLPVLEMYGSDLVVVRDMKKDYLMKNEINALITSVCGEGIDLPISPVVSINASGRKSFIKQVQGTGRIVRKNDTFGSFRVMIDFVDDCHPLLYEHSLERIETCKNEGWEVVIVDTVDELLRSIITYYKETKC